MKRTSRKLQITETHPTPISQVHLEQKCTFCSFCVLNDELNYDTNNYAII